MVTKDVYDRLAEYKNKRKLRTWNEVMEELLNISKSFGKLSVIKIMCSDMREATAILPVWYKKLKNMLGDEDLVVEALRYLKQKEDEPDLFVVDINKCEKPQNT